MSDTAIISLVLGILGVISWMLSLSYFLGRTTAKLDGLAEAFAKMEDTITQIFEKLDRLVAAVPHRCEQTQTIAGIQTQTGVNSQRLTELESWRHAVERTRGEK
jgi:hypothetical protein